MYSRALQYVIATVFLAGSGFELRADPATFDISVLSESFPVTISGIGTGGGFSGTIKPTGSSAPADPANFWCVDVQNYINQPPTSFTAFITALTLSGWDPTHTRYGTVPNGAEQWQYADPGSPTLPATGDDGLFRLRIAAYLTTQYYSTNTSAADIAHNQAIQQAIWRATDTTPPNGPTYGANDSTVIADYTNAMNYVINNWTNDTYWSGFRVVSGWYSGGLFDYNGAPGCRNCNEAQTFITVTPEPSSVVLLLTGVAAALCMIRRIRSLALSKKSMQVAV